MKIIFSVICITTFFLSKSQPREFGEISSEELKMTRYEKDLEANAIILFDIGESKFIDTADGGYDIEYVTTKRIKIFKHTDESLAEVAIPFYHDGYGKTEIIESIKAHTFNLEEGRRIYKPVLPSSIFEEQINNQWSVKKFIFPDVKDGSVLEYTYRKVTPFHFNLPDWSFQDRVPTIFSKYTVAMIPFYSYEFIAQGITRFDEQYSEVSSTKRQWGNVVENYGSTVGDGVIFQDKVYTYVMKDVPAFRDESYITSKDDYIMKIDFQLARFNAPRGGSREIITTWPKLIDDILKYEDFGKYLNGCRKFTRKILETELALNGKTGPQKVDLIANYVKTNFKWDGYYGKYARKSPKAFLAQKEGNIAEINLFLISMLNEAGIDTKPVLVSTRGNGKVRNDYPFLHFFNYVIAFAQTEQPILVDATDPYLTNLTIPARCLNDKALIIDKKAVNFIDLRTSSSSFNKKSLHFKDIDPNSFTASVQMSIQTTSYEAANLKRKLKDRKGDIVKYYSNETTSYSESKTLNFDKVLRPYIIYLQGETELSYFGDNIVIQPFNNLPFSLNPFTQEKRNYPIDFVYPINQQFNTTIEIPNGYKVSPLPDAMDITNTLATIQLTYTVNEDKILATGSYHFKKSVYQPSEYARIKSYFNEIIEHFNKEIVLEKI